MGGGAIRTAAKVAAAARYRSTAAARRAPTLNRGPAATIHVAVEGENAPLVSSISVDKPVEQQAVAQWSAWEVDDWEFAGGKEEELVFVSDRVIDSAPRLVFGPAPTFEEADEAAADLKEAIEKVYFSAGTVEESVKVDQGSDLTESKSILPAVPKHVIQAFSLLQESPEAQGVVASLASDKNVWDAVMKNAKVMEFCNKNQSVFISPETNVGPEESTGENENITEFSTTESPDNETSGGSAFFADIAETIKVKVSEMVRGISGFLQDFMGASPDSQGATKTTTSMSTDDYVDIGKGASFLALAIAVILVVLVKRG